MKYLISFCLLFLISCSSEKNPYPKKGEITREPLLEQRPVALSVSAIIPETIEAYEKEEFEYQFKIDISEREEAKVTVSGLPEGAYFDSESFTLSWFPDNLAGNDPLNPSIRIRKYPLIITIRDLNEELVDEVRRTTLIVYDEPGEISYLGPTKLDVHEGESFSIDFIIKDIDYPQGPFEIDVNGFDYPVLIEKINNFGKYQLRLNPSHSWVRYSSQSYLLNLVVRNPARNVFTQPLELKVWNKLVPMRIDAPLEVLGSVGEFSISMRDPNENDIPTIELDENAIADLDIELKENLSFRNTHTRITTFGWNYRGSSSNALSLPINYKICTPGNCLSRRTIIRINAKEL